MSRKGTVVLFSNERKGEKGREVDISPEEKHSRSLFGSWHFRLQRERAQAAEREKVGQAAGPGCQGPAVGGTAAVGGAAVTAQQPLPPPALLHQLPPARAGPSSELSLRDTDPLLSSTAHAPDQWVSLRLHWLFTSLFLMFLLNWHLTKWTNYLICSSWKCPLPLINFLLDCFLLP